MSNKTIVRLRKKYRKKTRKIRKIKQVEQNGRCFYCGDVMNPIPHDKKQATTDHIVPLCKGGSYDDPANIVAACRECNEKKKDEVWVDEDERQEIKNTLDNFWACIT